LSKQELLGQFSASKHPDFVRVPPRYCLNGKEIYLRKEVYLAYTNLYQEASKDSISIKLISGFRSFDHQKFIWEKKWKKLKKNALSPKEKCLQIMRYSAMPGSSRHHWGTDIDICALDNQSFEKGIGLKTYTWLIRNASNFGFCQVYDKDRQCGYNQEKWHWSYLPLASIIKQQYLTNIQYGDISGFRGSEQAKSIGMIKNYVDCINVNCK